MQGIRITTLMAAMIGLSLTAATTQAWLYEDGTFETPISSLNDGSGWEGVGVSVEDWANGAPGTGGNFGYAATDDDQFGMVFRGFTDASGEFYHDVPVEPARQYDFHIQSHTAVEFYNQVVTAGGTVAIVFSWYDGDPTGSGALVGAVSNNITSSIIDGGGDGGFPPGPTQASKWQDWDYMLTAPTGAAYLRSTVQWTASAVVTNGDEVIRWDNAQLTTPLDPLNETQPTLPVLELAFQTQPTVAHTVESTADITDGMGWMGVAPPVDGNDATQRVYVIPSAPVELYRVDNKR
jgi:hypothetical protein